jgi:uncharacterized membrane protein (Fun14 family)
VVLLSVGVWLIAAFFFSEAGSLQVLLNKLVDLIEEARGQIPIWLGALLPQSAEALQQWLTQWIRDHATQATQIGQQTGRVLVQILIGMVIGAMLALQDRARVALENEHGEEMRRLQRSHRESWDAAQASHAGAAEGRVQVRWRRVTAPSGVGGVGSWLECSQEAVSGPLDLCIAGASLVCGPVSLQARRVHRRIRLV